jgi:hypothetical protein
MGGLERKATLDWTVSTTRTVGQPMGKETGKLLQLDPIRASHTITAVSTTSAWQTKTGTCHCQHCKPYLCSVPGCNGSMLFIVLFIVLVLQSAADARPRQQSSQSSLGKCRVEAIVTAQRYKLYYCLLCRPHPGVKCEAGESAIIAVGQR